MYLVMDMPVFGTVPIDGVKVTKVHADGTFDAVGAGWGGVRCTPETHRLYNEDDGSAAAITVTQSETENLRQQLAMQDAVLQELLFSIIPMMIGGEL